MLFTTALLKIEIPQCTCFLKANYYLKFHNAHFKNVA